MNKFEEKRNSRIGQKFGSLTILNFEKTLRKNGDTLFLAVCKCDCCNEIKRVAYGNLKFGNIFGCGKNKGIQIKGSALIRLFSEYRARSIRRGIKFEIDIDYFLSIISNNCHYCDYPPSLKMQSWSKTRVSDFIIYSGIDRVDSNIGYTKENTVACCEFCNRAKNNRKVDKFLNWLNFVKQNGKLHT